MVAPPPPDPTSTEGTPLFGDESHSWELVRQFVQELAATAGPGASSIDWSNIEADFASAGSLDRAIGHVVVVADDMVRGTNTDRRWLGQRLEQFWRTARHMRGVEGRAPDRRLNPLSVTVSALLLVIAGTVGYYLASGRDATTAYHPLQVTGIGGNAEFVGSSVASATSPGVQLSNLPAATAPPAAAPPGLAGAPPLEPHEVFGFAPYWTLPDSAGFNLSGVSTLAYFSIGVNGDGSLEESGPGWNGYQSQALADLVTRAHGAGDRVVLAVSCFDQTELDQLTSSPTAPTTLAAALITALQAKNLDGVNLDFEGQGSGDQAGLTNLVTKVSAELHDVNSHYQVTMDTYASSAGDPGGFYNIRALAPAVNAFFVMQYQFNLQSAASSVSPLTSTMFSDKTTIGQYTAAVPASKVILGLPFFGLDWPTTNGTLTAQSTGPPTTVDYSQVVSSGHKVYWDATTDTAWTSYQVGSQWHETFFEDPPSLYDAAQLAAASHLAGVGIWALGLEGNAPAMLAALLGFSPALKNGPAGPTTTTTSTSTTTSTTSTSTTTTTPSSTTTTPTGTTSTSTTSTTVPAAGGAAYGGTWNGSLVSLTLVSGGAVPEQSGTSPVGQLTGFTTDDPNTSCLGDASSLNVFAVSGSADEYLVVATTPGDCTNADFTFTSAS